MPAPGGEGAASWSEAIPEGPADRESWARFWAGRRVAAKAGKDYPEADRIRKLLSDNGFEVRDRKDGVVEVVRR